MCRLAGVDLSLPAQRRRETVHSEYVGFWMGFQNKTARQAWPFHEILESYCSHLAAVGNGAGLSDSVCR